MNARIDDETLIDVIEAARESGDPKHDIATVAPDLTVEDAYRLQLGFKRRLAQKGDAHIGYRVSFTSRMTMAYAAKLGLITQEAARPAHADVFESVRIQPGG